MARRWSSVTPTVTVGAYSANDVIGGRLQFANMGECQLESVMVSDLNAQNVAYVLVLFKSVPTNIVDNATFDIIDADLSNIIALISLPTANRTAFTDNSVTLVDQLDLPLASNESDLDIWGFLYTTGTPTYAATSDITVVLQVR